MDEQEKQLAQIQQAHQLSDIYQRLTDEELIQASTYNDLSGLLKVLSDEGWTADNDIKIILDLIKQNEDMSLKLRAIKYLREIVTDAMKAAGLMVHATRTFKGADGSQTSFSTELTARALIPQKGKPDGRTGNDTRKSSRGNKVERFAGLATGQGDGGNTDVTGDSGAGSETEKGNTEGFG